jgi:hypothetical protein
VWNIVFHQQFSYSSGQNIPFSGKLRVLQVFGRKNTTGDFAKSLEPSSLSAYVYRYFPSAYTYWGTKSYTNFNSETCEILSSQLPLRPWHSMDERMHMLRGSCVHCSKEKISSISEIETRLPSAQVLTFLYLSYFHRSCIFFRCNRKIAKRDY